MNTYLYHSRSLGPHRNCSTKKYIYYYRMLVTHALYWVVWGKFTESSGKPGQLIYSEAKNNTLIALLSSKWHPHHSFPHSHIAHTKTLLRSPEDKSHTHSLLPLLTSVPMSPVGTSDCWNLGHGQVSGTKWGYSRGFFCLLFWQSKSFPIITGVFKWI